MMLSLIKNWFPTVVCFFFGFCVSEEYGVSGNVKSTPKCGAVFITISSIRGSYIELNWETNCKQKDRRAEIVVLYNADIRNRSQQNIILYDEVRTEDYPSGFYRTPIHFNMSTWPEYWNYNSTTSINSGVQALPYWIVSFSSQGTMIDIQPLKLQPTWMKDNSAKLKTSKLGNILIPGTHDSACYGDMRLFEDYILTQNMPIWHQLVFGIRYLDLRIAFHQDGIFYINHDFVKVRKVQTVYDQVKEFIKKAPQEIIIIDFHRFPFPSQWSRQLHHQFINYTLKELGDYIYSKSNMLLDDMKGPTMEQIWAAKKNLILTYGEKIYTREYPQLWESVRQAWANTISVSVLKNYLEKSLNQSEHQDSMLNALMAELTPRSIDVFTGTNTLRELANDVNSNVTKWVRDEWNRRVNIITSDFFLGNNLIEVAIEVNKNR